MTIIQENWSDNVGLLAQFLKEQDYSANTKRAYRNDIQSFVKWFESANAEPFRPDRVTVSDVVGFRTSMRSSGKSVATVNRCLNALRAFFGWLVETGSIPKSPVTKVKELGRQQLAPKGLEQSEIRRLLRECELRRDNRTQTIFALLAYTGIRVGELCKLRISDLTIKERTGSILIRSGKGAKERTVPLPAEVRRILREHIPQIGGPDEAFVFQGQRGPLTPTGVRTIFRKYAQIVGFTIYPHLFRHTFAHAALTASNNDLVGVSQLLGHESINTTAIYTQRSHKELGGILDKVSF